MEIDKQQEEMVVNFGVFGYNAEKIANIMEKPKGDVEKALSDKASRLHTLYQKGIDLADYVIDLKLFDMAKSGDIKALEKLEERKRKRK